MHDAVLRSTLNAVRRRSRWVALLIGASFTWTAWLVVCGVTLAADLLFGLSWFGRFLALALCLVTATLGLALGVLRVFVRPLDDDDVALQVEGRLGGMRNTLISALQLERRMPALSASGVSAAMIDVVRQEAAETAGAVAVSAVVPARRLKRVAAVALAVSVLAAPYVALRGRVVHVWALRLLNPFDLSLAYPTRTALSLVSGNQVVPEGGTVTVAAEARGHVPDSGWLEYERRAEGDSGRLACSLDTGDGRTFRLDVGPIRSDTRYRFQVGDARTPWALLTVLPRPQLTDLVVTTRLPEYVRAPDPPPDRQRDIEALIGSQIHLDAETRVPGNENERTQRRVQRATLVFASGAALPMTVGPDGRRAAGSFRVERDDAYQIHLAYDHRPVGAGPTVTVESDSPVWYRLRAVPDAAPRIEIVRPAGTVEVSPLGQVEIETKITDDYGVESARLWYAVCRAIEPAGEATGTGSSADPAAGAEADAPPAPEPVLDRADFKPVDLAGRFGGRRVKIGYDWSIADTGAKAGDRIRYFVSAADGRTDPGPNVTESAWREIAVVSMERIAERLRERQEAVQNEILRIYQRQKDLREDVDDLRSATPTSRPAEPGGGD